MFNVQLFGNSYLSRWEWDDWAWAEEMRENGGDQHFLKLTLSLPTSAHCSLPTTSAHYILAKLSKLPGFPCNCEWKTLAWYNRYILSIRPKCTKRRESGFHFRISINLLHPLLQLSTINTFYQICAKFLLFEKGFSSTSSGEDYYFSPKLVYLGF